MDPIDAITKITGGVLRRIADAIDNPSAEPAVTIHIETLHVHGESATTRRALRDRILGRS